MERNKKKTIGMILMACGITALCCTLFFIFFGSRFFNTRYEFEPEQEKTEQDADAEALSNQNLTIPGFDSVTIPDGQETVPFKLYNPEDNDCYFEITITLEETGEEIYKSKLVSPGQELSEITLNRGIDAGSYGAVVHYSAYSTDGTLSPLNGADINFTLIAG